MRKLGVIAALLVVASICLGEGLNGKFTGLDGATHTLREQRGHVTVVNLWATWCVPCKAEMPLLDGLAKEYSARGVTFVAISIDDVKTRPRIAGFVSQLKLTMPVWEGASADDLQRWSGDGIVPATLVLDERGNIEARLIGLVREKELKERIDWVLGGRSGKRPKTVKHL